MKLIQCYLSIALALSAVAVNATPVTSFDIGTEAYREVYQETADGSRVMKETANMYGINSTVQFTFNDQQAIKLEGRYAQGSTTYTGSYIGQPYGSLQYSGVDRKVYDIKVLYQQTESIAAHLVTGSLGLGYRKLTDHLDKIGLGGYQRENQLSYLVMGVEVPFNLGSSSWQIKPKMAYNAVIQGKQHSYIYNSDLTNTQTSGYGIELSTAFSTRIQDSHLLSITPFYRYWSIGKSDIVHGAYEPENTTSEAGLKLSLSF